MMQFTQLKAQGNVIDNPPLKEAIYNFLLESGDGKQNWEYLNLSAQPQNPDGSDWWDNFVNMYYISNWGGSLNIYIYTPCYGNLILDGIDNLNNVTIASDYLSKVEITNCKDFGGLNLVNDSPDNMIIPMDINISGCDNLQYVSTNNSYIDLLNISNCPSLTEFRSYNDLKLNKLSISGSDMLRTIEIFQFGENRVIGEIDIVNNATTNLTLITENIELNALPELPSSLEQLTILYDENNVNSAVSFSQLSGLKTINLSGCTLNTLPDFPSSLEALICNQIKLNGTLNLTHMNQLGFLDINNSNLNNLSGLPISLKVLLCYENELTNLNVSNLANLKFLNCSKNNLESLSLPNSLEFLQCDENFLSSLNNLPLSLNVLSCTSNDMEELNLSNLTHLKILNCSNNNIKDIKINDNFILENFLSYSYKDYFIFNYEDYYGNDPYSNTNSIDNSINYNNLLFSQIEKLYGAGNFMNYYNVFPQKYYNGESITTGETIDLHAEKGINQLSFTWYDVTNVYPLWDIDNIDSYSDWTLQNDIDQGKVFDVTGNVTDNNDGIFTPSGLEKKILLCKMSYEIDSYYSENTYYLVNILGESAPELEFRIKIDDEEYKNIPNNTITRLSNLPDVIGEEPIVRAFKLSVFPLVDNSITYDHWEIDYIFNHDLYTPSSGQISKDNVFVFPDTPDTPTDMYDGNFIITALRLYENGALKNTYSYAYEPYKQSVLISDFPLLYYQEAINNVENYETIENNITTTENFGNKVYLRMGIHSNDMPDPIPSRSHNGNYLSWEIEYTTQNGGVPVRSGLIAMDKFYNFNNGNPHQNVGTYPYSVTKLFLYRDRGAVDQVLRSNPASDPSDLIDLSGDPCNHTIIIKSDGTNPEPDPEVDMQFAVSIDSNSAYKDVPNHHTTTVDKGSSVYLRISALTKDISYSSWQIDYTTPTGQIATSEWTSANHPYVFNGGKPHTEKGTYIYKVNTLKLNDNGVIHSFSFTRAPYINTIVIKEGDDPGTDPNPKPLPGIDISTSVKICPDDEFVLLPFELKYTAYPLEYTIHFSPEAIAAGFVDQLTRKPLPTEKYLTIPLPKGIPAGTYKGTVKLFSKDTKQPIEDCAFEIKVLTATQIVKQPESYTYLCADDIFTLSVEAVGEDLSYQWYKDEKAIPGATKSVYEGSFTEQTAGIYHVVVKGYCGIVESEKAEVSGSGLFILMKWTDVMYVKNTDNRYASFQWYKDGSPIEKDGKSIYYTHPEGLHGEYFVRATTHEGVVEESCKKVFNTPTKSSSANMYPNPVKQFESLTIDIRMNGPVTQNAKVDIFDMAGRMVLTKLLSDNQSKIQVNLSPGSYVARVTAPDGKITTQIVLVK